MISIQFLWYYQKYVWFYWYAQNWQKCFNKYTWGENRQTNILVDCMPTHWSASLQCNCTKIEVISIKILVIFTKICVILLMPSNRRNPLAVLLSDFLSLFWTNMGADCMLTHRSASLQWNTLIYRQINMPADYRPTHWSATLQYNFTKINAISIQFLSIICATLLITCNEIHK